MERVVIVGGGQGGIAAAEALRERGFDGSVTIVDAEGRLPHRRPPLSKEYLADADAGDALDFRPVSFFDEARIDLELGIRATEVDHAARRLRLSDGRALGYEHLLMATGSTPRRWSAPGAPSSGVHTLHSVADADLLRDAMADAESIAIVGGGLIGLEVASHAAGLGRRVSVFESAPRLMSRSLSPHSSHALRERHRRHGVDVHLGVQVDRLEGRERPTAVHLQDGRVVAADLVVASIGSVAQTSPVSDRFVEPTTGGIAVDRFLRTQDPQISAVGDAAAFRRGTRFLRLESVQNATDQGRCFAARLTGEPAPFESVPWFWTDQAGVKIQMAGLTADADSFVVRGDLEEGPFSVLAFRAGRLAGAESFGRPADHIAVRKLLASGADLTVRQAEDSELDLLAFARSAA